MFKYMLCILILVLCLTHGARSAISCDADADCRTNGDPSAECTGEVCVCSSGFTGDICTSPVSSTSSTITTIFLWILGIGLAVVVIGFLVVGCYVIIGRTREHGYSGAETSVRGTYDNPHANMDGRENYNPLNKPGAPAPIGAGCCPWFYYGY